MRRKRIIINENYINPNVRVKEDSSLNLEILREIEEYAALGLYEADELGLPYPRQYGLAMRRLYENMPVRVSDTALLTPFEPYFNCKKSFGDAMNWAKSSHGQGGAHHGVSYILNPFHSSGFEIANNDSVNIVEEKKAKYPKHAEFIAALEKDLQTRIQHRWGYIHNNPDILQIVTKGFNHHKRVIDEGIAVATASGDESELNFMLTMKDFAAGIDAFFIRVKDALTEAASVAAVERKEWLAIIRDEFANCFYEPAQSFVGGLLAVNFLWILDGCDSIGRIDYALGELFERDIASGRLDLRLARHLLDDLWKAFEAHNGWNMQIGGVTPNGGRCYNELTRECLRCDARNKARRPNLALRVTKDMPDDVMDLALDSILNGTGTPALYNDELFIETLMKLFPELTREDAAQYGFGGCSETMIPGLSCCDSLAGSINLAHPLVNALGDGSGWGSFEELLAAFKAQVEDVTQRVTDGINNAVVKRLSEGDPKVARSMFTRDCLEKRKSFEAGGARYNWAVISYDGSTVAIDSLYAVKHLVYDTKTIDKKTLLDALAADFVGFEQVQRQLKAAPKFGNDVAEVDELAREIMEHAWGTAIERRTARGNGRIVPSVILFATYENAGKGVPATPNGRNAGKPLNDSIGAFEGADRSGPTALLNSVMKLPQTLAPGTPILNVRVSKNNVSSKAERERIKALIRTYFAGGGMQIQITVLSSEEMRAAQKEPDKYGDLIVRIGGYSEYFIYLSPGLQETVIARAEL